MKIDEVKAQIIPYCAVVHSRAEALEMLGAQAVKFVAYLDTQHGQYPQVKFISQQNDFETLWQLLHPLSEETPGVIAIHDNFSNYPDDYDQCTYSFPLTQQNYELLQHMFENSDSSQLLPDQAHWLQLKETFKTRFRDSMKRFKDKSDDIIALKEQLDAQTRILRTLDRDSPDYQRIRSENLQLLEKKEALRKEIEVIQFLLNYNAESVGFELNLISRHLRKDLLRKKALQLFCLHQDLPLFFVDGMGDWWTNDLVPEDIFSVFPCSTSEAWQSTLRAVGNTCKVSPQEVREAASVDFFETSNPKNDVFLCFISTASDSIYSSFQFLFIQCKNTIYQTQLRRPSFLTRLTADLGQNLDLPGQGELDKLLSSREPNRWSVYVTDNHYRNFSTPALRSGLFYRKQQPGKKPIAELLGDIGFDHVKDSEINCLVSIPYDYFKILVLVHNMPKTKDLSKKVSWLQTCDDIAKTLESVPDCLIEQAQTILQEIKDDETIRLVTKNIQEWTEKNRRFIVNVETPTKKSFCVNQTLANLNQILRKHHSEQRSLLANASMFRPSSANSHLITALVYADTGSYHGLMVDITLDENDGLQELIDKMAKDIHEQGIDCSEFIDELKRLAAVTALRPA